MIHTIYISREFTFRIIGARPESRPAGRCKKDVPATFSGVGGFTVGLWRNVLSLMLASSGGAEEGRKIGVMFGLWGAALSGTFLRSRLIIVMRGMKIQDSKLPSSDSSNALQKAKTDVQKPERIDEEAEEEQRETESWHTFKTP